jgi:hypothetical protein
MNICFNLKGDYPSYYLSNARKSVTIKEEVKKRQRATEKRQRAPEKKLTMMTDSRVCHVLRKKKKGGNDNKK